MGELTTGDVADLVGGDFLGDRSRRIERVATLAEAGPEDLSFLGNARYDGLVETSNAGAILVSKDLESHSDRYVRVSNPYVALAKVLSRWFDSDAHPSGVSDLSFVAPDVRLGTGVGIGAFAVLGAGATIGDGAIIYDGVSIGADVEIGEGTIIYARAVIYAGTKIGRRCVIHSGAVIGSDGYGFANDEGRHVKIPQLGIVRIEDDVEIGACTTIDRGALGETVIGEGCKLDNLVQVAHGVKIGKHTLLVSQSGVAGSTEIGAHCILAGQAGTYGHLKLGDGVVLTARAVATKDWEGPVQLAGFPGTPLKEKLRADAMVGRLPNTIETVKRLEQRVSELERRLEDDSSQESE